jgi:hypothetical protein
MKITAVGAAVGVCLVVASARAKGYPLPYEGILLVTMTIFLLSGMLARDAMLVALICLVGILAIEWSLAHHLGRSAGALVLRARVLVAGQRFFDVH